MRLGHARLVALDARAGLHEKAALLPAAAEELVRREEVEVGLLHLGVHIHGIDRAGANADHEVAGVLLLDFVHEVAPLCAVLVLAPVGRQELVADAREVVEVLEPALALLGAVLEHAVAGAEGDLAADDLVLRVVVAADLDLVDHDRHALGDVEHDIGDGRIGIGGDVLDRHVSVGKTRVARTDRDFNAPRGVGKHLRACDGSGLGKIALRAHGLFGILGKADELRLADDVASALVDVEAHVNAAVLAAHAFRAGDLDVEIAAVAEDFLDLRDALHLLLGRDGLVGEPPEGVPPRKHVDRLEKFVLGNAGGARKNVRADLLLIALVNYERDRRTVAFGEHLDDGRDLDVVVVLLLVGGPDPVGRLGEIGLAIEVADLELRLLEDLGRTEGIGALHGRGCAITHFPLHEECDLDAVVDALCVGRDVLELRGVLERADVSRQRRRIVFLTLLRLATARDGARIAAKTVERLEFDVNNLRRPRGCGY